MQTPTLDISPFLTCEYPDPQQPAIRKCKQEVDDFAIGSGKFYEGTATGKSFLPVGVDGVCEFFNLFFLRGLFGREGMEEQGDV